MHIKVRQNRTVESTAIYNIPGVGMDGRKDLIGLYSTENEGVKLWFSVLTDLKQRGVDDSLLLVLMV